LGHDGKLLRRYHEAAQTATELHKLAKVMDGTTVKANVAMIYDYDSVWALRLQPGFARNNYHEAMHRYYNAFFRAGVNVDMIQSTDDFSKYRAVIAPDLYVLPDAVARALSDYVAKGGVLLTDCRTGVKDETNLCHARTLPGLLSDALGISIEEYEGLPDDLTYAVAGSKGFPETATAIQYADWIKPGTAEVLAGYTPWHMKKFAVATRNRYGKGVGYYVGAVVKEPEFYDALIADLLKVARVKPVVNPPAGVEVSMRQGKGRKLLFLMNHTEAPQTVTVPKGKRELLTGKVTGDSVRLEIFGVAVIKL